MRVLETGMLNLWHGDARPVGGPRHIGELNLVARQYPCGMSRQQTAGGAGSVRKPSPSWPSPLSYVFSCLYLQQDLPGQIPINQVPAGTACGQSRTPINQELQRSWPDSARRPVMVDY